jgi:hypothetical protein
MNEQRNEQAFNNEKEKDQEKNLLLKVKAVIVFVNKKIIDVIAFIGETIVVFPRADKWSSDQRQRAILCIHEMQKAHKKLKRKLESEIYQMEKHMLINSNFITVQLFNEVPRYYKDQCKKIRYRFTNAADIDCAPALYDEYTFDTCRYTQRVHSAPLITQARHDCDELINEGSVVVYFNSKNADKASYLERYKTIEKVRREQKNKKKDKKRLSVSNNPLKIANPIFHFFDFVQMIV